MLRLNHRPAAGLRQPHWQLLSLQRQAPFWQPQEQVPHAQVPQQLDFAVFFIVMFFTFDMIFLLFLFCASCAFIGADVHPAETLQSGRFPLDRSECGVIGWRHDD